jgi:hypothetical protein
MMGIQSDSLYLRGGEVVFEGHGVFDTTWGRQSLVLYHIQMKNDFLIALPRILGYSRRISLLHHKYSWNGVSSESK